MQYTKYAVNTDRFKITFIDSPKVPMQIGLCDLYEAIELTNWLNKKHIAYTVVHVNYQHLIRDL